MKSMVLKNVRIQDIDFTENSRSAGKDLSELMASIDSEGLKQPIIVCRNHTKAKKPFKLVVGNRRIGAVKSLGLKTISALVDSNIKNVGDFLIANLTENLQREDVPAYEVGRYIHLLVNEEKMTIPEIAVRLGKNPIKVKDLMNAYHNTPVKFRDKIVSDAQGKKIKEGYIALTTAAKINNALKQNHITRPEATKLYSDAAAKTLQGHHVNEILGKMKEGMPLNKAMKEESKVTHINVRVKLDSKELQELRKEGTHLQLYFESLLYGEGKGYFTRPRV